MRLADFILANVEPILAEWEAFARTIWPPGFASDPTQLRDHAAAILRATALDMASAQTEIQRTDKSQGQGENDTDSRRLNRASDLHGVGRVESGFNLNEVISEYRALRATVIQLWRKSIPAPDLNDIDDLTRFNESIDQSLAKAVNSFTARVDHSRKLFLAILGHDLRNPLNAITMSARLLRQDGLSAVDSQQIASMMGRSAGAMGKMLTDLLDFTNAGLGGAMPVEPAPIDLAAVCSEVVREIRAAHPQCTVRYDARGDLTGDWDAARLRQLLSNLLGNAVQHGATTHCAIDFTVDGHADFVTLAFHNLGPPIPPEALPTIFDPLVRVASPELQRRRRPGSIGLGLYIARQIALAHGGEVDVASSQHAGTTFTVRLPRRRMSR